MSTSRKVCTCSSRQAVISGTCFTCGGAVEDRPNQPEPSATEAPVLDPMLGPAADFLRKLGPVAEPYRNPEPETRIVDGVSTMKCACDKVVETITMKARHSGVCPFIDNICHGCEGHAKGLAVIICATCHRVCGRLPPATDPYGFKIEPERIYHVQECALCQPGKFKAGMNKSPIIEMVLFHRKMGVKS